MLTLVRGDARISTLAAETVEEIAAAAGNRKQCLVLSREGTSLACARELSSTLSAPNDVLDALSATKDGELRFLEPKAKGDPCIWLFGATADWSASKEDWLRMLREDSVWDLQCAGVSSLSSVAWC